MRLITLIGPGGVGKTRLGLELARAIAEEGSTRVAFVPLAAIRDPGLRRLRDCGGSWTGGHQCVRLAEARTRRVRGSLDVAGARQLRAGVGRRAVGRRSPSLGGTSPTARSPAARHSVCAESRSTVVGPLALEVDADAMSPANLARSPAVRLFVERVRDVQPDFRLHVRERPRGDRDLSAARCPAAGPRACGSVDESADG